MVDLLFLKNFVCGSQNSQKKVSNLYWEALFSGLLHQHTFKYPINLSGLKNVTSVAADSSKAGSFYWLLCSRFCHYFSTTATCRVSTGKTQNFTINIYVGCLMLMVSLKTAEQDVDVTDSTE